MFKRRTDRAGAPDMPLRIVKAPKWEWSRTRTGKIVNTPPPLMYRASGDLYQGPGRTPSLPARSRERAERENEMSLTKHAVVIAGGGPTGLMLAAELALAGIESVVVLTDIDEHAGVSRLKSAGLAAYDREEQIV